MGTSMQRLAEQAFETKVGVPLGDYVRRSHAAGGSWRTIAREVREATGGLVDVTHVTLINWYGDGERGAA